MSSPGKFLTVLYRALRFLLAISSETGSMARVSYFISTLCIVCVELLLSCSCIALCCSFQMETFAHVPRRVYHIERDIDHKGSLVFSTSFGFYTVNLDRQPPSPQLIAGREGRTGYSEGKGTHLISWLQNRCVHLT